jgi:cobalt-precorrin 5A hydrolase
MESGEAMSSPAVMGVGCRSGVTAEAVIAAAQETLALAPVPVRLVGLHTSARKLAEVGLREAAARLTLALHFHAEDALKGVEARIASPSKRVAELTGVGSVAEAAALCGAGGRARLLVSKHSTGDVSCAIALLEDAEG